MHENGQAALQGGLAAKSRRKEGRDWLEWHMDEVGP